MDATRTYVHRVLSDGAGRKHFGHLSVALCAPGELWGGVEQFVETLSSRLITLGVPVVVITLFDGPLRRRLQEACIPVVNAGASGAYDPRSVVRIVRILREHRVNIFHCHGYKATVLGAVASKAVGARLVRTEHGRLEPASGFERFKMRLNERLEVIASRCAAKAVVFVSEDVRRHSSSLGDAAIGRVVYNGIQPFEVADQEWRRARQEVATGEGIFNLAVIGRLSPVKGHKYLLEALAIARRSLDAHLYVFGDGPLEGDLRRLTNTLGLDEAVHFMGFRQDVRSYLGCFDAVAMPSLHEGLPYTLLEAMYARVPVIASRVGGLAEIISDDLTGLLVPPACAPALASAIERLHRDPRLRVTLCDQAFALARDRFLVDTMTAHYVRVYEAVMGLPVLDAA